MSVSYCNTIGMAETLTLKPNEFSKIYKYFIPLKEHMTAPLVRNRNSDALNFNNMDSSNTQNDYKSDENKG